MKSIFILCGTALCLIGSTAVMTNASREFQIVRHNGNNVELCVSNYGKFGQDETGNNAGCWWPIGSGHNYIYGAGIWFGTVDSLTGDTLVSVGYLPYSGASEFAPGRSGMSVNDPDAIIYLYPSTWPPNPNPYPMAPNMCLSHQDSWCCYNDSDISYHVPGDTRPIGLEVYQTVYVWNLPAIEDVVWFFYDVKNVSGARLNDCHLSVTTDCDIGNVSTNDICTGIVHQMYAIGGDTNFIDYLGYQWQTASVPSGAIGFDLLQTPFLLEEGHDRDLDGIPDQYERDSVWYVNNLPMSMWDVDNDGVPDWRDASQNPQIGMTAFKQFTVNTEPQLDPARYMTLAGYNYQTGIYEPYDTLIPAAADQRFLMSSGFFDLGPDSIATIAFAIFFADWYGIYGTPDTALVGIDAIVQDYYDMYWYLYTGIEENIEMRILDCEMRILPNPVSNTGVVSFSLPTATRVSLKLYNTLGQLVETVYDGFKTAGVHESTLSTQNLPQGTYFVVLDTGDFNTCRSIVIQR
jgi:hypothetical protein